MSLFSFVHMFVYIKQSYAKECTCKKERKSGGGKEERMEGGRERERIIQRLTTIENSVLIQKDEWPTFQLWIKTLGWVI